MTGYQRKQNTIAELCIMRQYIALLLLFILVAMPVTTSAQEVSDRGAVEEILSEIREEIRHGNTFYWLARARAGRCEDFNRSLEHLRKAQSLSARAKQQADDDALLAEIEKLEKIAREGINDTDFRIENNFDTMMNVFPLYERLSGKPPSLFEYIDDPAVVALTNGMKPVAATVIAEKQTRKDFQEYIVCLSQPEDRALEDEARFFFGRFPQFFPLPPEQIAAVLTVEEISQLRSDSFSGNELTKLARAFKQKTLGVIQIELIDKIDDLVYYGVTYYNWLTSTDEPERSCYADGFAYGRSREYRYSLVFIGLILTLALLLPEVLTRFIGNSELPSRLLRVASFGLGFGIFWGGIQVCRRIAVDPTEMAIKGWYWLILASVICFVIPAILFILLVGRFLRGGIASTHTMYYLPACYLGACAYLGFISISGFPSPSGVYYAIGYSIFVLGIALTLSKSICLYMRFASAQYKGDKLLGGISGGYAITALTFAMLIISTCNWYIIGTAIIMSSVVLIALYFAVASAASRSVPSFCLSPGLQSDLSKGAISEELQEEFRDNGSPLSQNAFISIEETESKWRIVDQSAIYSIQNDDGVLKVYEGMKGKAETEPPVVLGPPATFQELRRRLELPEYIRREGRFLDIGLESMKRMFDWEPRVLLILGDAGLGKTRLANETLNCLKSEYSNLRILSAKCNQPERIQQSVPYDSFNQALARLIGIKDFNTAEQRARKLRDAIEGVGSELLELIPGVGTLLNISNSLLGLGSDEDLLASPGSDSEFFKSISAFLQKHSMRNSIIIFFDDIQWMDEASRSLLGFLINELASDSCQIGIICTCRSDLQNRADAFVESLTAALPYVIVQLEPMNSKEIGELLTNLGFSNASASNFGRWLQSNADGNILFSLEILRELPERFLDFSQQGIRFVKDFHPSMLGVPKLLKEQIRNRIAQIPAEYRLVLECAAHIGKQFDADEVALALRTERLTLLNQLRDIERDHGIIRDVRETDNVYEFRSDIVVQVLLEQAESYGTFDQEEADGLLAQIVREYQYRITEAIETRYQLDEEQTDLDEQLGNRLFNLANHSYQAGQRMGPKAFRYCKAAAEAAMRKFTYSDAIRYANMAFSAAEWTDTTDVLEIQILELELLKCKALIDSGVVPTHAQEAEERKNAYDVAIQLLERSLHKPVLKNISVDNEHLRQKKLETMNLLSLAYYRRQPAPLYVESLEVAEAVLKELQDHDGRFELEEVKARFNRALALGRIGSDENLVKSIELMKDTNRLIDEKMDQTGERKRELLSIKSQVSNTLAGSMSYAVSRGMDYSSQEILYLYQESLNIKLELKDRKGQAMTYGGLGRSYSIIVGDYEKAIECFEKDLEISVEIGDHLGIAVMNRDIAACAEKFGRLDEALDRYRNCRDYSRRLSFKNVESESLCGILRICLKQKDWEGLNIAGSDLCKVAEELGTSDDYYIESIKRTLKDLAGTHFDDFDPQKQVWFAELSEVIGYQE